MSNESAGALEFNAIRVHESAYEIRSGGLRTDWMDSTRSRFAYRCLPLLMARQSGWELLCPATFSAVWRGGDGAGEIELEGAPETIESHFGEGVLTFRPGWLFTTSPGYNLWVKGPTNHLKHGIAPLEGLVETDWARATFTLNWMFTAPDCKVTFYEGEPIASLVPIARGTLGDCQPIKRTDFPNVEFGEEYKKWSSERRQFKTDLHNHVLSSKDWQGEYFRGVRPNGQPAPVHQTRAHLKEFRWADPSEA